MLAFRKQEPCYSHLSSLWRGASVSNEKNPAVGEKSIVQKIIIAWLSPDKKINKMQIKKFTLPTYVEFWVCHHTN